MVEEVYYEFRYYSGAAIPPFGDNIETSITNYKDQELINDILDQCAEYSDSALLDITIHQEPWKKANAQKMFGCTKREITQLSMYKYFTE